MEPRKGWTLSNRVYAAFLFIFVVLILVLPPWCTCGDFNHFFWVSGECPPCILSRPFFQAPPRFGWFVAHYQNEETVAELVATAFYFVSSSFIDVGPAHAGVEGHTPLATSQASPYPALTDALTARWASSLSDIHDGTIPLPPFSRGPVAPQSIPPSSVFPPQVPSTLNGPRCCTGCAIVPQLAPSSSLSSVAVDEFHDIIKDTGDALYLAYVLLLVYTLVALIGLIGAKSILFLFPSSTAVTPSGVHVHVATFYVDRRSRVAGMARTLAARGTIVVLALGAFAAGSAVACVVLSIKPHLGRRVIPLTSSPVAPFVPYTSEPSGTLPSPHPPLTVTPHPLPIRTSTPVPTAPTALQPSPLIPTSPLPPPTLAPTSVWAADSGRGSATGSSDDLPANTSAANFARYMHLLPPPNSPPHYAIRRASTTAASGSSAPRPVFHNLPIFSPIPTPSSTTGGATPADRMSGASKQAVLHVTLSWQTYTAAVFAIASAVASCVLGVITWRRRRLAIHAAESQPFFVRY